MVYSGGISTKPEPRTNFSDVRNILLKQILQLQKHKFFQNPGTQVDEKEYIESMLRWTQASAPEFLPETIKGCLPFIPVLPRTFVGCKRQMELIENARGEQIVFNEFARTISIRTGGKNIIFKNVDFSTFYNMVSSDQHTQPYLIFSPPNLEKLQEDITKFSPEEILAIIFHYTNTLE